MREDIDGSGLGVEKRTGSPPTLRNSHSKAIVGVKAPRPPSITNLTLERKKERKKPARSMSEETTSVYLLKHVEAEIDGG